MTGFLNPLVRFSVNAIEDLIAWGASNFLGADISSYIKIETATGDKNGHTVVLNDATQMTVFEVMGAANIVGERELQQNIEAISDILKPYLNGPGRMFSVFFERDPEGIGRQVTSVSAPAYRSAAAIGLECEDLIEDRSIRMKSCCAAEVCYLAVYTTPMVMDKDRSKKERMERAALAKKHNLPLLSDAQNPFLLVPDLVVRHDAMVDVLEKDLSETVGLMIRKLTAHEAVRAARLTFDGETMADDWLPTLPGDKFIPRMAPKGGDASDLFIPKLSHQVSQRPIEIIDDKTIKIGKRYIRSMVVEFGQREIQSFAKLFRRVGSDIPWRISYVIDGRGVQAVTMKSTISSIIGFLGEVNKRIKAGIDAAEANEKGNGKNVALRMMIATWASSAEELDRRAAALLKTAEGWGQIRATETVGDAVGAYVDTNPLLTNNCAAVVQVPPLESALEQLPLSRPASPWTYGMMLRTPDGKLFPYQAGSTLQATWIDLIFAPPGSGKSVLMNCLNLALILAPGSAKLPLIAVIDVGPSSLGLINLVRDSLPEDRKHEAGYFKLLMSSEYAINPWDTQLGRDVPMASERGFLVNVITLMATPVGSKEPFAASQELAGLMVDEAYKMFGRSGAARRYEPGIEAGVDAVLKDLGFAADTYTTWWEVVDFLFEKKYIHEATKAQRYAVPRFSDLVSILQLPAIRDVFSRSEDSKVRVSTGETLVDAMMRIVSSAIREYPVLAGPTRFDIGDCRVVSIDLNEVARGEGEAGKRQAALMFMLARYVAAKNFYIKEDTIVDDNCPPLYRAFHAKRASEIWPTPKAIRFDEFHRTGGIAALREQVKQDMREGRKWNTHVTLASQYLDDFVDADGTMVKSATSVFILKTQDDETNAWMKSLFALSDESIARMKREVHGPQGERGANLLAVFSLKDKRVVQILNNRPGPIEMWAFSTTAEDMVLRDELYKRIGQRNARAMLAERFPGGSAGKEFERRRVALTEHDDPDVVKTVVVEIERSFYDRQRRAA